MHGPLHLSLGECDGPPRRHSGFLKFLKSPRGEMVKLWAEQWRGLKMVSKMSVSVNNLNVNIVAG